MKVDHFVGLEDLAEADQKKAKATLSRAQEEASRLEAAGGAYSAAPKRSKSGETAAVRPLHQPSSNFSDAPPAAGQRRPPRRGR